MKKLHRVFIGIFFAMLVIPLLLVNTDAGAVSPTENRLLANFPPLRNEIGELNGNFPSQLNTYLNDRIGFRHELGVLNAHIKLFVLRTTPNDRVRVGLDGWHYFTFDSNIEIAKGTYPLTDADLDAIKRYQRAVADYYESKGVDYLLMLSPSKTSIYPEFIDFGGYTVRETPVDILDRLLTDEGIVTVSPKDRILAHKDEGLLFRKYDAHWTNLGAYYAYCEIVEQLNEVGIHDTPLDIEVVETPGQYGEYGGVFGDNQLFAETIPDISFQASATNTTSGSLYDGIEAIVEADPELLDFAVFENPHAKNGTLLLYGDSQEQPARKIPQLLAEHFKKVVYVGIKPKINLDIEALVNPDVVIFARSERYINVTLVQAPCIPIIVGSEKAMSLPLTKESPTPTLHIDGLETTSTDAEGILTVPQKTGTLVLTGWIVDDAAEEPLSALYLKVGDTYLECFYGIKRKDVADVFGKAVLNSGFGVTIPRELIEEADEFTFYAVSADGSRLIELPQGKFVEG
ncbi:MAG: hypothetical protein LBG81_06160 [Coriobacteriaceae bacterium]|jgi:hypothetical protein|nr:hypothetical protein [Coriobacteriaceae bacterium]